ncbi:MAG: hypothetical protein AB1716_22330 [Planctomycetota bacterium]
MISGRADVVRKLYLAAAALLVIHHVIGVCLTVSLEVAVGVPVLTVGSLGPYAAIMLLVAVAFALGFTRWWGRGAVLLAVGLVSSAGLCAYDMLNHRWQMNGGGTGATYTLWWWYYEPFWYGYRPGNV